MASNISIGPGHPALSEHSMGTCASCNASIMFASEVTDEMRASITGAIGYGADPRSFIGVQCNRCERSLCSLCAFGEYRKPGEVYACVCGGQYGDA